MPKHPNTLLLAICFALGIALVVQSGWPYQPPPNYSEQPPSTDDTKSNVTGALADTSTAPDKSNGKKNKPWYSTFTDHTPEWLIAIFTGTLWWSTRRLWKSGEKQIAAAQKAANAAMLSAKAAIGIELPIIGVDAPDLQDIDAPIPPDQGYASGEIHEFPRRYSIIPWMYLRNGGRTPAFLAEFAIGHTVSADEPTELVCDGVYPFIAGEIVESGGKEKTHVELHYQIELSDLSLGAMKAKRKYLWLFVLVTYVDFLQEPHTATFIWRWNNPGGGLYFFERGGGPYTQWTPASQPNRDDA